MTLSTADLFLNNAIETHLLCGLPDIFTDLKRDDLPGLGFVLFVRNEKGSELEDSAVPKQL